MQCELRFPVESNQCKEKLAQAWNPLPRRRGTLPRPPAISVLDLDHSDTEVRWVTIGRDRRGRVLVLIHAQTSPRWSRNEPKRSVLTSEPQGTRGFARTFVQALSAQAELEARSLSSSGLRSATKRCKPEYRLRAGDAPDHPRHRRTHNCG